jgi:hypothetical protein
VKNVYRNGFKKSWTKHGIRKIKRKQIWLKESMLQIVEISLELKIAVLCYVMIILFIIFTLFQEE